MGWRGGGEGGEGWGEIERRKGSEAERVDGIEGRKEREMERKQRGKEGEVERESSMP